MNPSVILFNLKEAEEELQSLIAAFESSPDLPFESYHAKMAHLYHHLNTAWNARNVTREQWRDQSDSDSLRWEQPPTDMPLTSSDAYYDLPEYDDLGKEQ